MHISNAKLATALIVMIVGTGSTAWAQRAGQNVSIQHGVVTDARSVDLEAEAGRGAALGGLAGAALSSGRSSSSRARNAILGTAIGAAASSSGSRARGMQYTVDTGAGMIMIVSDQTQIQVGDCVSVEQGGGGSANIRRASPALCESQAPLSAVVTEDLREEATECIEAKEAVLNAETDEDIADAIRTARIMCDD